MAADSRYHPMHRVRQITKIPVFQYFCNLPKDIRLMIYEDCFTHTYIQFRSPEHEIIPFLTHTLDDEVIPSDNPSLLSVSKAIRQEALPVFAQCIASIVLDGPGLAKLPRSYLTHVKEVSLTTSHMDLLDERFAPRLQMLRVWVRFPQNGIVVYGSTQESLCSRVVAAANDTFEKTPVCHQLVERYSNGKALPFKVYLCLSNVCYGDEGVHGFRDHQWNGVVVDWAEEKVVEGFPPPKWDSKDDDTVEDQMFQLWMAPMVEGEDCGYSHFQEQDFAGLDFQPTAYGQNGNSS